MVESRTRNPKVASSSLGPAGIVGEEVNVQRSHCVTDGLNAEHEFGVWVTVLGCISCHFYTFTHYSVL